MVGGPGLAIETVNGTEDQEARGKQDMGKKATTSAFGELINQTTPSTNKPGLGEAPAASTADEDDDEDLVTAGPSSKKPAKVQSKSKK